jgi:hypothetical protein
MALLTKSPGGWTASLRLGLVLGLIGLLALRAGTPPAPTDEEKLKAVFLFNFAQFVDWPATTFARADAPLVIGVLGEDPFGAYLDELVEGEQVGSHPLLVHRYHRGDELTGCHILFVSRSESDEIARLIPGLKGRSILTISDAETFTRHGGMVRFVTEAGKIRLRINVNVARDAGLTLSSKILRPATIVTADRE